MSLLLEALKKAEKAKEEAQRKTRGDAPAPAPVAAPTELRIEGDPAPAPAPVAAEPVLTRDQLPDIRQPLEIEPEAPQAAPARPAPEKPRPQPRAEPQAAERETQRTAARKVFEAKFKEPNPRLPFFITMGALGVFAVGTVIYFWIQLRPAPALVNTNPQRPADEVQVAAADIRPTTPAPAAAAAQSSPSAIPGLPASAPAPKPAPVAKPAPQATPVTQPQAPQAAQPIARAPERPVLKPVPRPPTAPQALPEVTAARGGPQVHPKVSAAYAAYTAGDLASARSDYEQALRDEPANRDALLGLAAVDVRSGRYEAAEATYLRLLLADPRDAHAQAALIALRGGRGDPVAAESRVKSMLADNPGAHVLNFTLGNQLAQQGRWAEAQAEYFKAFSAEPENADFAYNLAVALDHLRQPKVALEYYRRALALAKARGAGFDLAAAQARAAQLAR
jgi:tetratricopeptide (TPR) repeat protein